VRAIKTAVVNDPVAAKIIELVRKKIGSLEREAQDNSSKLSSGNYWYAG
jgi:hypothetical protein